MTGYGYGLGWDASFGQIDAPLEDQWPYHAVSAVVLAHSLLRSYPEVDASRIGVTGISWGGYLTCIVAGIDDRLKCAVPVYGCGFLGDNSAWVDRLAKKSGFTAEVTHEGAVACFVSSYGHVPGHPGFRRWG